MSEGNGSVISFTHELRTFELEGYTFRRRKVDAREWAETLQRVSNSEQTEVEKVDGGLLIAVSADGMHELILLGIYEDDHDAWLALREAKRIEFGELSAIRAWLWEQMTERPFTSGTPSSDGPGQSSEVSSKDASSSPAVVRGG